MKKIAQLGKPKKILVVKPTFSCNADCISCHKRRELYKERIGKTKPMDIEDYRKLFAHANKLGFSDFCISGGEPTLYPKLAELVKEAKRYNWFISVNTNGTNLSTDLATKLLDAGLDRFMISLYSAAPEIQDSMRAKKGLHEKAVNGIKTVKKLKKKYNFRFAMQTLMSSANYKDLDNLLGLACDLGADHLIFAYLEGGPEGKMLLSENEIRDLKSNIIPRMMTRLDKLSYRNGLIRYLAKMRLNRLFEEKTNSLKNYSHGIYRDSNYKLPYCNIPNSFALVLPDGSVLPCNTVEYSHEPIVGNLFKNDFTQIWEGQKWEEFRRKRYEWCQFCPMHKHFVIALK